MMSSVIYVSQSVHLRGNLSDIDIVKSSQINNERDDLTGCLIRGKDWFAQLLEGEHADVTHAFDRIRGDHRHRDIRFWWNNERGARRFPEWRMIFAHADDYGVDLLPLLRDQHADIHIKQDAMGQLVARHLSGLGLREASPQVDQPAFKRPMRRQSAP